MIHFMLDELYISVTGKIIAWLVAGIIAVGSFSYTLLWNRVSKIEETQDVMELRIEDKLDNLLETTTRIETKLDTHLEQTNGK